VVTLKLPFDVGVEVAMVRDVAAVQDFVGDGNLVVVSANDWTGAAVVFADCAGIGSQGNFFRNAGIAYPPTRDALRQPFGGYVDPILPAARGRRTAYVGIHPDPITVIDRIVFDWLFSSPGNVIDELQRSDLLGTEVLMHYHE
jgi:hypothetical protein